MTQTEVVYTVGQEVRTAQDAMASIKPRRIYANRIALPISDIYIIAIDEDGKKQEFVLDLKGLQGLIMKDNIKILEMYWNGLEPNQREENAVTAIS